MEWEFPEPCEIFVRVFNERLWVRGNVAYNGVESGIDFIRK